MIYLEPHIYADYTKEDWDHFFDKHVSSYYSKGAHMDYAYLRPIAEKAEDQTWQQSKLEKVKAYLMRLL